MKYWWFFNPRCEFKFRGKSLFYGLNDLSIPPYKYTKGRRANLVLHFSGAKFLCWNSAHLCPPYLKWSASCTVFANFPGNKSRSEQKKYTTFINSSWAISERKMREVNFPSMCHIFAFSRGLVGHSLLRIPLSPIIFVWASSESDLKFLMSWFSVWLNLTSVVITFAWSTTASSWAIRIPVVIENSFFPCWFPFFIWLINEFRWSYCPKKALEKLMVSMTHCWIFGWTLPC